MEQKQRIVRERSYDSVAEGQARQATRSRLQGSAGEDWVAASNWRNKARMLLKIKSREVQSQVVEELGSRSKRLEVGRRWSVTLRLSTLDFSTRISRNKARMSMKTKDC